MPPFSSFEQVRRGSDTTLEEPDNATPYKPITSSPQQETPATRKPKSVHFSPEVVLIRTLHINDYTDEEIFACWFDDDECQATKDDVARCAQMVAWGVKESEDFCIRGLEFRTPEGAERRVENKEIGWDSVLEVQDIQIEYNWNDPVYMANVYRSQTEHCVQVAHFRALRDAKEVATYC